MSCLLLRAGLHNWGLICTSRGDWLTVTWYVHDDGSYDVASEFGIKRSDEECMRLFESHNSEELRKTDIKLVSGLMKPDDFEKLKTAIFRDPWLEPDIESGGCDGVAWEIEQYAPDGTVERSNKGPDYIYGHRNLEYLVSCLPRTDLSHGASGYMSVSRKEGR